MYKKNIFLVSVLLILFIGVSYSSPVIKLKHGLNEVFIKVSNKCNVDLESISLIIENEDLPEGIIATVNSQSMDIAAKDKSENGLLLNIEVDKNIKEGIYQIPFRLKDNKNHTWNFTITANIEESIPDNYELKQNYPNPCNPITQIRYVLANDQAQDTRLVIFNSIGKQIRTLVNQKQSAGTYKVIWDGRDGSGNPVSSGIYFYRITSGSYSQMRKIMLIK